jgi:hypothetical protein
MAGRIANRRELRKQVEQAEAAAPAPPAGAKPKGKKTRSKKAPARLRVRWGVFDGGMKQVAIFDYNQRAAADQKVADLSAKKGGGFFLQVVKEPMPEPEPEDALPG